MLGGTVVRTSTHVESDRLVLERRYITGSNACCVRLTSFCAMFGAMPTTVIHGPAASPLNTRSRLPTASSRGHSASANRRLTMTTGALLRSLTANSRPLVTRDPRLRK